jgi:hypothetical protein
LPRSEENSARPPGPANISTVLKLVLMDRLFVVRSPTRLARGH